MTPGIIEVLWKSNKLAHHTIGPPTKLKSNQDSTHFGCSFQICHGLVIRAIGPQKLTSEERKEQTTNQDERSKKKRKKDKSK
jgi:hypothetical protein